MVPVIHVVFRILSQSQALCRPVDYQAKTRTGEAHCIYFQVKSMLVKVNLWFFFIIILPLLHHIK